MSLDTGATVEVAINWTEGKQLTASGSCPFPDSKGGWFFFDEEALWRVSGKESMKKKIGGGGKRVVTAEKERIPLGEYKFVESASWYGHQVEEGVIWCVSGIPTVLLQVDTRIGQVECIWKDSGVSYALPATHRCLIPAIFKGEPVVYFHSDSMWKIAYLRTKVVQICEVSRQGRVFEPSRIRPTKEMTSSLVRHGAPQIDTNSSFLANTTNVWSSRGTHSCTFVEHVVLGDKYVLSYSQLCPLLAISSNKVLAVETKNSNAWIVLVDWTLAHDAPCDIPLNTSIPSSAHIPFDARYFLPADRINRLSLLPAAWRDFWDTFLFDSSSNQLLFYKHRKGVVCFANVFNIKIPHPSGGNFPIYPHMPSTVDDLSKLLLPECPLPYDLQLTHSASNTSWNVHYNVLNHHEGLKNPEDIDRLAKIVKNSTLPANSISSFLKFLYFSSPGDLTNAIESFMPLCHCIQLCNQVGIGSDSINFLLWLLETKVVQKLPTPVLLQNILTLWLVEQDPSPKSIETYSKTSPLMSLFAYRCRKYASNEEIQEATVKFDYSKVAGGLTPDVMGMCTSFSLFLSSGSSISPAKLELSSSPPYMALQHLKWDENLSLFPQTPPADKYSFVFTIKGLNKGGVICNALYLYPQWRWFERLCKTKNCEEFITRHVAMPEYYSPSMIIAILSSCYGICMPIESLTTLDAGMIYRGRSELHLPDGRCFAQLVENCRESLSSAVNDSNCLEKLQEFWAAGFELNSTLFVDTLKVVIKNKDKITLGQLSKLHTRFRIIIGACLDDNSVATPEDFTALATAFEQSKMTPQPPS